MKTEQQRNNSDKMTQTIINQKFTVLRGISAFIFYHTNNDKYVFGILKNNSSLLSIILVFYL